MRRPFHRAHKAVEAHDAEALARVLEAHPEVARASGKNGNGLLSMAVANRDAHTSQLLLDAGADPDHPNVHGWTALHQAGYANLPGLAQTLLDAGADPSLSARGDGGTPFVAAAFWGNRAAMEVLPRLPRNLRTGAAAGDLSELDTEAAGAHRGYYRPHSGFPEWTPSDDPQEVLDEALCWAARCDRSDVLAQLVDAGADLEADVYRGTALAWAAATGALGAMRALLDLGARPDGRTSFGGEAEDVTPLGVAEYSSRSDAAALLRDAGA